MCPYFRCFLKLALLQLSRPITPNPFVRSVKLPTDCGIDLDRKTVIAVGNGDNSLDGSNDWDPKIRHAYLRTRTTNSCGKAFAEFNRWSILCVRPNHGQSTSQGDSGN